MDSFTPVTVNGLAGVTAISTGDYNNCALLSSRTVNCSRYNSHGQNRKGTTTNSLTPVTVNGL